MAPVMSDTLDTILRSDEFSCCSGVARIEKVLRELPVVAEAKVQSNTGRIEVTADLAPHEVAVPALPKDMANVPSHRSHGERTGPGRSGEVTARRRY